MEDAIIVRLNKIQGQLQGVIKMYEVKRDCLEITQQISAVRNALSQVHLDLLEKESENCIINNDKQKLMQFIKEILKKQ